MSPLEIILISIIVVLLIVIWIIRPFNVSETIIKEDTYDSSLVNMLGQELPNGKVTRVVIKRIDCNGRIKFITKSYKH